MMIKSIKTNLLGASYLFHFFGPLMNAWFFRRKWYNPNDIKYSIINIAYIGNYYLFSIIFNVLISLNLLLLGILLWKHLKKQNNRIRHFALGCYIVSIVLQIISRLYAFKMYYFSTKYLTSNMEGGFLKFGEAAYNSMYFLNDILAVILSSIGTILFYYLIFKSKIIPRLFSAWGIIALVPILCGTICELFGSEFPLILYIADIPLNIAVGVYILVMGLSDGVTDKAILNKAVP